MKEEWKVFIRGNEDRGKEVIKALTDLGGKSSFYQTGIFSSVIYYIRHDGIIDSVNINGEFANIIKDNYKEIKLPEHWKDGDILINNDGSCYKVFSDYDPDNANLFYTQKVSLSVDGKITECQNGVWVCHQKEGYRLATSSEVEYFHKLLRRHNKYWDAEKKQLVDCKKKQKVDEVHISKKYKAFREDFDNVDVKTLTDEELKNYADLCNNGLLEAQNELYKRGL